MWIWCSVIPGDCCQAHWDKDGPVPKQKKKRKKARLKKMHTGVESEITGSRICIKKKKKPMKPKQQNLANCWVHGFIILVFSTRLLYNYTTVIVCSKVFIKMLRSV